MAKFSKKLEQNIVNLPENKTPIQTTTGRNEPTTFTATGGAGWERTAKGELFLLAVTNMVSEQTFHEASDVRDQRYVGLIHTVAKEDPVWFNGFLPWLRNDANMRSASLVAAVEFGRATASEPSLGQMRYNIVDAACQRADEPGEMLAYYWATNPGHRRIVAKWLQRGLSEAAKRLYNERSVLKYDTPTHMVRMADVINMCRPDFAGENVALFDYILHRRQGHKPFEQIEALPLIQRRLALESLNPQSRRGMLDSPLTLKAAGVTWEWLSSWLPGGMDAQAWEAVIPSMGYMALLRNLRNFDQAGVSQAVKEQVAAKLSDPNEVARSRQFPFRFLSAYKAVNSDFWRWPLEQAVNHSLANIEGLDRPLILVDISPSMFPGYSNPDRNGNHRYELAALFGTALALRSNNPTLVAYDSPSQEVHLSKGASVLKQIERFAGLRSRYGGTETFQALHRHYRPGHHQSVVILTDEQSFPSGPYWQQYRDPAEGVKVPVFNFNLAGYKEAHMASGSNRYSFGGLTDSGFKAISAIQKFRTVGWPWETQG